MSQLNKVQVCNIALSFLGCPAISSIDENSTEAVACRVHYDMARRIALQSHDWAFARKVVSLALVSNAPEDLKWTYTYAMPSDCLQPREIINRYNDEKIKYEIRASADGLKKRILTNEQYSVLKYTADITSETMFDELFVRAFSLMLAMEMCNRLTGSNERNKVLFSLWQSAMTTAKASSANSDNDPNEAKADTFIKARR